MKAPGIGKLIVWALPLLMTGAAACSDDSRTPVSSDAGADVGCVSDDDCDTGTCREGECTSASCDDGVTNGDETDTDCGGGFCEPCRAGEVCEAAADCESRVCRGGACAPPACDDGVENGSETATDCGGPECPGCEAGDDCEDDADCESSICQRGTCAAASCTDGVKGEEEADTDCGGPECGPCEAGADCERDADCESRICRRGICRAPTCADGVKNGDESDVDCGGPTCSGCPLGGACSEDGDCRSESCSDGRCDRPTCSDGVENGQETDVDCGGPDCEACSASKECSSGDDCRSTICTQGTCTQPTCSDGVQNGNESGPDCGGDCPGCDVGAPCRADDDCTTGVCTSRTCADCRVGDTQSCYSATPGTAGVGECQSGTQTCGTETWSACVDEVTPTSESCGGGDEDCDGVVDEGCPCDYKGKSKGVCKDQTREKNGNCPEPAAYEKNERSCDTRDNDCDGVADPKSANCGWVRLFGDRRDEIGGGPAVGTGGEVFLSGTSTEGQFGKHQLTGSDWDGLLGRYDSMGNFGWFRPIRTPQFDRAGGVATDGSGGVYVTGWTAGDLHGRTLGGGTDAFLIRYDQAGQRTWTRLLGDASDERAFAVSADAAGGIALAGDTDGAMGQQTNAGGDDAFASRYDWSGNRKWAQSMGTPARDTATGVAIHTSGAVSVVGKTRGDFGGKTNAGFDDVFARRFSRSGNARWTTLMGTPSRDSASDVAADGSGGVFVTGRTSGKLGGRSRIGSNDGFVVRLDASGRPSWTRLVGTPEPDSGVGIAAEPSGGVYVVGKTRGDIGGQKNAGKTDVFVARFTRDGSLKWTRMIGTPALERAHGIAVGSSGGIYVVGRTKGRLDGQTNDGQWDVFLWRVD